LSSTAPSGSNHTWRSPERCAVSSFTTNAGRDQLSHKVLGHVRALGHFLDAFRHQSSCPRPRHSLFIATQTHAESRTIAPSRIKLLHPVGRQPRALTSFSKHGCAGGSSSAARELLQNSAACPTGRRGDSLQQSDLEIRHAISSTTSWTPIRCPADTGPTSTVAGTSRGRHPPCTSTMPFGSSDDCKIQRSRHLAVGVAVFLCDDKRRRLVRLKRGSQAGTPRQASAAGSIPDAVASGKSPERANSSGGGQRPRPGQRWPNA
jgi:hypothetical protein